MRWLRFFRRREVGLPLSEEWREVLGRFAPFRQRLKATLREELDRRIAEFVAEKNWEGCAGFRITDEHRVTIAAHALRLTLGFEGDTFGDVSTVLVYPTAYEGPSTRTVGGGMVLEGRTTRLGESWYHGPVIFAWSDILSHVLSSGEPHNVILHEFAHQLDYRNGREADGTPAVGSYEREREWQAAIGRDYDRLCDLYRDGRRALLDEYATTNLPEFFAVATEAFFETPGRLYKEWPHLFRLLSRYYGQDPRSNSLQDPE